MGQSTDAILVYGVDLGEELPDSLSFDEDSHDEKSNPVGYAFWMGKAVDGVELVSHCSDRCPMYILAAAASETRAWRGDPKLITELKVDPAWDAALDAFADANGIELPKRPGWLLASWWS